MGYAGLPWPLGRNLHSASDRGVRRTLPESDNLDILLEEKNNRW